MSSSTASPDALAGVVAAQRRLQELEEPVDAAAAAVGLEVLVPETHERVGVLAPFLGEVLGVGGEVGEVLDERTARVPRARSCGVVERDLHLGAVEEATAAAHAERHARHGRSASSNSADCALTR